MSLKQKDGSFIVSRNGEVDIRGIYCLLVCATLLDMLTPELVDGIGGFIASIQTYEGGFASASQPYYMSTGSVILDSPRPTLGEAHGGYTGCAVAAWAMVQPFLSESQRQEVDLKNLLRWLVMMQGDMEEDGGGFRGRSNKLVDGCYSWWCAGSLTVVESLIGAQAEAGDLPAAEDPAKDKAAEEEWTDDDEDYTLYSKSQSCIHVLARAKADYDRSLTRIRPWRRARWSRRTAGQTRETR